MNMRVCDVCGGDYNSYLVTTLVDHVFFCDYCVAEAEHDIGCKSGCSTEEQLIEWLLRSDRWAEYC